MNIKVVSKELNNKTFDEISNSLLDVVKKLEVVNEDIRLSALEIRKQSEEINRFDIGIESVVLSLESDKGKPLYSNDRSRNNAVKQRKFDNTVYQKLVKSRAKWEDDLNKLKIEKSNLERSLKAYRLIAKLFICLK